MTLFDTAREEQKDESSTQSSNQSSVTRQRKMELTRPSLRRPSIASSTQKQVAKDQKIPLKHPDEVTPKPDFITQETHPKKKLEKPDVISEKPKKSALFGENKKSDIQEEDLFGAGVEKSLDEKRKSESAPSKTEDEILNAESSKTEKADIDNDDLETTDEESKTEKKPEEDLKDEDITKESTDEVEDDSEKEIESSETSEESDTETTDEEKEKGDADLFPEESTLEKFEKFRSKIDAVEKVEEEKQSEPQPQSESEKESVFNQPESSTESEDEGESSFLNKLFESPSNSAGKNKQELKEVEEAKLKEEEEKEKAKQEEMTKQIASAVGEAVKAVAQTGNANQAAPQMVVYDTAEAKKEEEKEQSRDSLLSAIFEGEKKEQEENKASETSEKPQVQAQKEPEAPAEIDDTTSSFLGFGGGKDKDTPKQVKPVSKIETEPYTEEEVAPKVKVEKGSVVSIGEILTNIVIVGLEKKASDIHIEPRKDGVLVRYRIDGILIDDKKIDKELEKALIFKTKVNAKLRTDEHFAPQDGRIVFNIDNLPLNTRISILPTASGEKIVIRLLTQRGKSFDLADLGFRKDELETIRKNYTKPYGTIIAAGPTGSGKTTTLYAILSKINSREINITTVEDPVEYELEGVNHVQINAKAGLSFERGLRSILRQDPDVIMIGEIRDKETAEIAINAAMTGHLVLSTIHTNDSITAVPRLIDMGVEPFLVASAVNLVVAQRLARKLCEDCKETHVVTKEELTELDKIRPDLVKLIKEGEEIYQEVGCDICNGTGFSGRVGLYEIFEVTQEIRKIILEDADSDKMFQLGRQNGMHLIIEDGVKKLREGMVSVSELLRVTALKQ